MKTLLLTTALVSGVVTSAIAQTAVWKHDHTHDVEMAYVMCVAHQDATNAWACVTERIVFDTACAAEGYSEAVCNGIAQKDYYVAVLTMRRP